MFQIILPSAFQRAIWVISVENVLKYKISGNTM